MNNKKKPFIQKNTQMPNYVNEYRNRIVNLYDFQRPYITCLYFNFNIDKSITKKDDMQIGSYSIFGENSGLKWDEIFFLPLFHSSSLNDIDIQNTPEGMQKQLNIQFTLSNNLGFSPTNFDFLYIIDDMDNINIKDQSKFLFRVHNMGTSDFSTTSEIKINCKQVGYTLSDVQKNINDKYIFNQYYKRIFSEQKSIAIHKTHKSLHESYSDITFNQHLGLYYHEMES